MTGFRKNLERSLAAALLLLTVVLAAWNRRLAADLRQTITPPVPILTERIMHASTREGPLDLPAPLPPPRRQPAPESGTTQTATTELNHEPTAMSATMRRTLKQMAFQSDPRARLKLLRSLGIPIELDDALAETDGHHTRMALAAVLGSSEEHTPASLMAWAQRLPAGDNRQRAIQAVAHALSREDPLVLAEWLWQLPDNEDNAVRNAALSTALRRMASSHPEEAEQWLNKLGPDWPHLSSLASQLARQRIRQDLSEGADWANTLDSGPLRDEAFSYLAQHLAAQAPETALEWCMAIESDSTRSTVLSRIVPGWVRQDADAAAAWVESLPEGEMRDASLLGLINGLSSTHPETAALWVDLIDKRGTRRAALGTVVSRWARTDSERTAEWINSMEPGLVKDTALQRMALAIVRTDPEAAMLWAESIQNGTMRSNTIKSLKTRAQIARGRGQHKF